MTDGRGPDPQQRRVLARVAVVFAGLIVFRLLGDRRALAGLLLWAGIVVAGFPIADRLMGRRAEPGGTFPAVPILVGLALALAGAFLASR